jgi:hypothetical protein
MSEQQKQKQTNEENSFPLDKGVMGLLGLGGIYLIYGKMSYIWDLLFLLAGLTCTWLVVKNSIGLSIWVVGKLDTSIGWQDYLAKAVTERVVNAKVGPSSTSTSSVEKKDLKDLTQDELLALLAEVEAAETARKEAEKQAATA